MRGARRERDVACRAAAGGVEAAFACVRLFALELASVVRLFPAGSVNMLVGSLLCGKYPWM